MDRFNKLSLPIWTFIKVKVFQQLLNLHLKNASCVCQLFHEDSVVFLCYIIEESLRYKFNWVWCSRSLLSFNKKLPNEAFVQKHELKSSAIHQICLFGKKWEQRQNTIVPIITFASVYIFIFCFSTATEISMVVMGRGPSNWPPIQI